MSKRTSVRQDKVRCLRRHRMSGRTFCLSAVLVFVLALAGQGGKCSPGPPWIIVESYEQVKEELVDMPGIIYPDISRYDVGEGWEYRVNLYIGDYRIRNGYEIYSLRARLLSQDIDTKFVRASFYCTSIKYYYDERNPCPPLGSNMSYRSIPINYSSVQQLSDDNRNIFGSLVPDGTLLGAIGATFDLSDYRYSVGAQFLFTPSEQITTTYEQKLEQARAELFVLVDDILDQGGVEK